MTDMKALKVRIGLRPNGHAAYPDFNSLPVVESSGIDWSYYIGRYGLGWQYDKQSGHVDDDLDSPRGQQWGVIVVEPIFADQAAAAFPADCSIIDEAELTSFWDNKANAHLPDEEVDDKVVDSLKKQVDLIADLDAAGVGTGPLQARLVALRNRVKKAVDPDDPEPGVKKNLRKKWSDYKVRTGINIVP